MDPLVTNRIDPALLRVIEKRGNERETLPRRRPTGKKEAHDNPGDEQENAETPKHELDDLA